MTSAVFCGHQAKHKTVASYKYQSHISIRHYQIIFCSVGYSDPFCEVKLQTTKIFRTGTKKKTLSPNWNESVTFQMSEDSGMLEIVRLDIFNRSSIFLYPLQTVFVGG